MNVLETCHNVPEPRVSGNFGHPTQQKLRFEWAIPNAIHSNPNPADPRITAQCTSNVTRIVSISRLIRKQVMLHTYILKYFATSWTEQERIEKQLNCRGSYERHRIRSRWKTGYCVLSSGGLQRFSTFASDREQAQWNARFGHITILWCLKNSQKEFSRSFFP